MALRTPHGTAREAGAIYPINERLPVDELPDGKPGVPDGQAPGERGSDGRFRPGNRASRNGGKAKAGYRDMAARLGLVDDAQTELAPYRRHAREWRDDTAAYLAANVGGGELGPVPTQLLDSAALSLMWSRYLSDKAMTTGDGDMAVQAMKLGEQAGKLQRDAWEYAGREAKQRPDANDPRAQLAARRAAVREKQIAAAKTGT